MYYITRFGSYNFLTRSGNFADFVGSGGSFPSVVRTPDGFYDFRLDTRAPLDLTTITARKLIYAPDPGCVTSAANVYRDLRALRGQRLRLFRTWKDTPFTQEWCWARLENVDAVEEIHGNKSPLFALSDLAFTQLTPYWYGQGWGDTDYTIIPYYEGQTLSTSAAATAVFLQLTSLGTTTHQITNRGNRDVLWVEADMVNGELSASNYTIQVRNVTDAAKAHGWIYDATSATGVQIAAGETVTVHGGKKTVTKAIAGPATVNVFSEFLRVGVNEQWLVLYPGVNDIEVTIAGPGTVDLEILLNYFDAWD